MNFTLKFSVFTCIFVLYGDCVIVRSENGQPEILSGNETIIQANGNYTIRCQGNGPLKWIIPVVKKDKQSWTKFVNESEKPINKSYKFASQLQIVNMSYHFVGYYHCHYADADIDNKEQSAKIYVYVNDADHLTPLKLSSNINEVTVVKYDEAVLPCKPTSPDVKVDLFPRYNTTHKVPLNSISSEKTLYRYDSLRGFITNDTRISNKFKCIFKSKNKTQIALVNLKVEEKVNDIAQPHLRDTREGHTVIGETLTLQCIIQMKNTNNVHFNWTIPSGKMDNHRIQTKKIKRSNDMVGSLIISNTKKSDKGKYVCIVWDNQNHNSTAILDVNIFDVTEHNLFVEEQHKVTHASASAENGSVVWKVMVKGHPVPSVKWFNSKNETIKNGTKYEAYYNSSKNEAFLKIKTIKITDFGHFTLQAVNNETKTKLFFLNVTDHPRLKLDIKRFLPVKSWSTIECSATANPEPEFHWFVKPCQNDLCNNIPVNSTISKIGDYTFVSKATFKVSESGYLKCFASNHKGSSSATEQFYVSDVKNGFGIFSLDSDVDINEQEQSVTIAKGYNATVSCGTSNQNYSDVKWFFKNNPLINNTRYILTNRSTKYSNRLQLEISNADASQSGIYSCGIVNKKGEYIFQNMTFNIANPESPQIINSTLQNKLEINVSDPLVLYCKASGIPKPTLRWYKNGVSFDTFDPKRIWISENKQEIKFLRTIPQDEGTYKCEVKNRKGAAKKEQTVKFKNLLETDNTWVFAIITLLSLISIAAIIFIVIKIRKEKQLQSDLKLLGLANFQKGAVENINPELGIDEQAELLPYDQKWEFPIENLKLGKQLGSGAFGVVMKGVAKKIVEGEDQTTVAVKMVKNNADHIYIKALASELKIMVHLGKHLNIVNLLGACTKNVAKKELLVILEFCRFGNLQNYLLRHRDSYVNQVDSQTGKIDYTIGQEYFDRTYSVSSEQSSTQSPLLKYAALTFSSVTNESGLSPSVNGYYKVNSNSESCPATDANTTSQGEDGVVVSNNSVQPEWRSNYRGDYKGNVKPICTKDLLAWAFQVARGMDYLASRKVLHGDLAARNVLLADNNIVKICDFGLAKSMYKNDNYKKKGNSPLPIKWMAIESIRDRVFSTQSDVWSFGIVLWELFSLARTPYPGMEADERLYQKLLDGYRMEEPQFAPKEVYKMMTDCWSLTPLARPTFQKLSERLGSILDDTLTKHYIDLNDPYLVMNTQRIGEGHCDYLAMLHSPTFEALSSPHYVNEMVGQEPFEDPDYMRMQPSTIFSPRLKHVFDFNVAKPNPNSDEDNGMELLPMLRKESESECERSLSPVISDCFSNPSYHIPLNQSEDFSNKTRQIVNSKDNYVDMLQCKEKVVQKNPFADVSSDKDKARYVNICS